MCCQYFSCSCKIGTICVCVCMCDETELMTERFFPVLAVGFLRDCKFVMFCGDTVIVRRFVCTVANNANWFRNMYLYVFIYVHYIYGYVIHPSMALQPLLGPGLPQKPFPFFCLLLVHTHTHTHIHTHTHVCIYIYV